MKRLLFIILTIAAIAPFNTISADNKKKADRKEWFAQMRQYEHEFIADEIDLSKEQKEKFFPIYDAMKDELHKVQRETRQLERSVAKNDNATDVEYESAAKALIELKQKESAIELIYFDKFKEILSAKQLFKLKKAERKFTNKLRKEHHKKKKND